MKKIFILVALSLVGCASPQKMDPIKADIVEKGKLNSQETIGLNSSGEAIIQQKLKADQELKNWVWSNNDLEQQVNSERYTLKRCREESVDTRLGGSGEVIPLPEVDNLKPTSELREQIGLINDDIVVVKEEFFKDRLKLEKSYNKTLDSTLGLIKGHKEKCEFKLSQVRVKAGLPAQRTVGKFKINSDGTLNKVVERHERSLDDAFEIKDQKRQPSQVVEPQEKSEYSGQ